VTDGIPAGEATYGPARNAVLLALALSRAEALGARDLFVGVSAGFYPDTRPAFVAAFDALANAATRLGEDGGERVRVHAPLLHLDKAGVVALGHSLRVPFELTLSCYAPDPAGRSCGRCEACRPRLDGFAAHGIEDLIAYSAP
jgi:7-cyano-7-deazaguanine synthase